MLSSDLAPLGFLMSEIRGFVAPLISRNTSRPLPSRWGRSCAMTTAPRKVAPMHIHSPAYRSATLSALASAPLVLKMDTLQPSGSFKIRGHGHLCSHAAQNGTSRFVCSSGGNAGAAVAYAANALGLRATIVIPKTTPAFMIQRLRNVGAEVIVHGDVWDEADARAKEIVASDDGGSARYVSPFDDPLLWAGHASIVRELVDDLRGAKPAAIVVSVGGGGLFLGVAAGCEEVGWGDVPIVAAETAGADSFAAMMHAGGRVVQLDAISSIAKSLGALAVSEKCAEWVRGGRRVVSEVVTDTQAVQACVELAIHHRVLVEPACGAAVAAAIQAGQRLFDGRPGGATTDAPIVVIVCGGNMASPSLLASWVEATGASFAGDFP